jgi:hypothetical protein
LEEDHGNTLRLCVNLWNPLSLGDAVILAVNEGNLASGLMLMAMEQSRRVDLAFVIAMDWNAILKFVVIKWHPD